MENLRPNEQRAKNAITMIWFVFALEIVSLISGYMQYDLLQFAANGGEISTDTANVNDTREQIIAILYLIVYIISGVTFIQWFRRAYFNLHIRVNRLSHSEGWAAGSWFVPVINLFRPYQIMKELYHETINLLVKKGFIANDSLSTEYLGPWWALWIINNFLGQAVFRSSINSSTVDELINSTLLNMFGNLIGIPLALITIKVIKDYSKIEPMLHEIKDEEVVSTEEKLA